MKGSLFVIYLIKDSFSLLHSFSRIPCFTSIPAFFKFFHPSSADFRVRVNHTNKNSFYPAFDERINTWRCFSKMRAGFQVDIDICTLCCFSGLFKCIYFRMRPAEKPVVALPFYF